MAVLSDGHGARDVNKPDATQLDHTQHSHRMQVGVSQLRHRKGASGGSTLATMTFCSSGSYKTLGASQIAGCKEMLEQKSNETSRRGVTFGNSIVRIADVHGYKTVSLSSAIIAKDGTAKEQVSAIERTFAEGRELLLHWRKVTQRMYPA